MYSYKYELIVKSYIVSKSKLEFPVTLFYYWLRFRVLRRVLKRFHERYFLLLAENVLNNF